MKNFIIFSLSFSIESVLMILRRYKITSIKEISFNLVYVINFQKLFDQFFKGLNKNKSSRFG